MASQNIGTFYGYANNNPYGRYTCVLYWDSVTRSGKNVTIHNPRVVMTKTDTDKYTVNRIAGYAVIQGQVVKNNVTLNAYQAQSPNTITFSLGTTTVQTTGTKISLYVAIASTGGNSNWDNFQSTPLEYGLDIACPAANPTYTKKPTITDIQETSLVINRGETDITSKFYYKQENASSWIQLTAASTTVSSLSPNTTYKFQFKAVNNDLTDLETQTDSISAQTLQYPYVSNISNADIEIGGNQILTIYNPLGREVSIYMTHDTQAGAIIYQGKTSGTSHTFAIPEEPACLAIGKDKVQGTAKYFCTYSSHTVTEQAGIYKMNEAAFKPQWDETNFDKMFKYKDGNANIVNITQDDQILVQGYSLLYYGVDTNTYPAVPSLGSEISQYQININHGQFSNITSSGTASVNSGYTIPNTATNITIELQAIDARGYKSNKIVRVIKVEPYRKPYGSIEAYRDGGYGDLVKLIIHPMWSINDNNVGSATYAYGVNGGAEGDAITTTSFNTEILLPGLDNEANFNFVVILTDKLGNSSEKIEAVVGIGEPILFIDAGDSVTGVGINCFPESNGLYVKGDAVFKDTAIAQQDLIVKKNSTIEGHLNIGSHRNQYFERNGQQRTGWFYIGGNQ